MILDEESRDLSVNHISLIDISMNSISVLSNKDVEYQNKMSWGNQSNHYYPDQKYSYQNMVTSTGFEFNNYKRGCMPVYHLDFTWD